MCKGDTYNKCKFNSIKEIENVLYACFMTYYVNSLSLSEPVFVYVPVNCLFDMFDLPVLEVSRRFDICVDKMNVKYLPFNLGIITSFKSVLMFNFSEG